MNTTTSATTPRPANGHLSLHRDGTVTVWDVYTQSWVRTARPSNQVLASLPQADRDRVVRHTVLARILREES